MTTVAGSDKLYVYDVYDVILRATTKKSIWIDTLKNTIDK